MPRQQPPDQQQFQKSLNPDNLIADEETEDEVDTDLDTAEVLPDEGDQRLAQDERENRPDDNIDQAEDDDAEDDEDEDESDAISQRP